MVQLHTEEVPSTLERAITLSTPAARATPAPDGAEAATYETIVFDDGSQYTGTLRAGQPDGLGTCTWKDGNQYDGEWRAGVMHGFGTYLWASGQRYDGEWKDGKRDGIGVKKYSDGSTFDGFWRDGKKHGVGVFRPAQPEKRIARTASGRLIAQSGAGNAHGSERLTPPAPSAAHGSAASNSTPAAGTGTAATPEAVGGGDKHAPTLTSSPQPSTSARHSPAASQQLADLPPMPAVPLAQHSVGSTGTPPRGSGPQPLGVSDSEGFASEDSLAQWGRSAGAAQAAAGNGLAGAMSSGRVSEDSSVGAQSRSGVSPPQAGPARPGSRLGPNAERTGGAQQSLLGRLNHARTPSQLPAMGEDSEVVGDAALASPGAALPGVQSTGRVLPAASRQVDQPSLDNLTPSVSLPEYDLPVAGVKGHVVDDAATTVDSVTGGPAPQIGHKVLYIRRFDNGKLVREEKLTNDDLKAIFKGVWAKLPKQDETRSKRVKRRVQRAFGRGPKLQKKAGQLIYKGMPGYDLMIQLQHGIRQSIGRMAHPTVSNPGSAQSENGAAPTANGTGSGPANAPQLVQQQSTDLKLTPQDFRAKTKVFFPSSGSHNTPAHPSQDFKWKDYSPKVFHALRVLWGIQDAEYMLSIAGSSALRQLNSPGKSGCMFFLSDDQQFLVKTMRKSEIHTLVTMLPEYYAHMVANKDSLVPRFYGVYGVKQVHGRTVRFVVMSNIFNTDLQIHRKFDLKGSTHGRTAGPMDPLDTKTVWKDLDLDLSLKLPKELHERLQKQLVSDVAFLTKVGVMDYSLLLGVHFCSRGRTALLGQTEGAQTMVHREHSGDPETPRDSDTQRATNPLVQGASPPQPRHPTVTLPAGSSPPVPDSQGKNTVITNGPVSPSQVLVSPFATTGTYDRGSAQELGHVLPPLPLGDSQGTHTVQSTGHALHERLPVNFDLFSNKEEVERQLAAVEARMRQLNYSEQKVQDVLGLAKLTILGGKLKKNKPGKHGKRSQSQVVRARVQARQEMSFLGPGSMAIQHMAQEGAMPGIDEGLGTADERNSRDSAHYRPFMSFHHSPSALRTPTLMGAKSGRDAVHGPSAETNPRGRHRIVDRLADAMEMPSLMGAIADPFVATDNDKDDSATSSSGAEDLAEGHLGIGNSMLRSASTAPRRMLSQAVHMHPATPPVINPTPAHFQKMPLGQIIPAAAVHHSPSLLKVSTPHSSFLSCIACGRVSDTQGGVSLEDAFATPEPSATKLPNKQETDSVGPLPNLQPAGGSYTVLGAGEEEVWVCLGIIDILQEYNTRKLFERTFKQTVQDGRSISVAPPDFYGRRFLSFMKKHVFPEPLPPAQVQNMTPWHTSFVEALPTAASLTQRPSHALQSGESHSVGLDRARRSSASGTTTRPTIPEGDRARDGHEGDVEGDSDAPRGSAGSKAK